MLAGTPAEGYAGCCEALAELDLRDRLAAIEAPTLVVTGDGDPVAPPETGAQLAASISGARHVTIAGRASHHERRAAGDVHAARARPPDGGEPMSDSYERGMEVRRAVLGDEHVDRAIARTTDFTADFQDLITRYAWGEIWTRPGLDRRTRSCITLTALVAGGHEQELAMHIRAALRNGLTPDEIKEVLLQTAIYCGVPAANSAFAVAQEVLAEEPAGMSRAVVLSAVRTPVGRYGGGLAGVRPDDLAALAVAAAVERSGVDPAEIEDVYLGCANQAGEDNRNVARMAALLAGLPDSVAGVTVNRLCASGLSAVVGACHAIAAGDGDLFVAGGVESMSRAPLVTAKPDAAFPRGDRTMYDSTLGWRFPNPAMEAKFPLESMGETGENVAERWSVSREDQDAFALRSQQRWAAADFSDELVPAGELEQRRAPQARTRTPRSSRA